MTKQELKDLIDAEVNTNGQRRITGAKLNAILKAIVDSLPIFDTNFANRAVVIGEDGLLNPTPKFAISANGDITIDAEIITNDIQVHNDATVRGSLDINGNVLAGNAVAAGTDLEARGHGLYLYEMNDRYLVSIDHGNIRVDQDNG